MASKPPHPCAATVRHRVNQAVTELVLDDHAGFPGSGAGSLEEYGIVRQKWIVCTAPRLKRIAERAEFAGTAPGDLLARPENRLVIDSCLRSDSGMKNS